MNSIEKMVQRQLHQTLLKKLFCGKTLIVFGTRQVGKTTLIKSLLKEKEHLFLNTDDPSVREQLTDPNTLELATLIKNHNLLFIDEAQRITNIGITARIIHDQFPEVQLILSGSSAFELRDSTSESLTGRKFEYLLYPISYQELEDSVGYIDAIRDFDNRLIYGFYPDVINHRGEEREVLNQLTDSYLFKDILAFGNIKKPEVLEKILRALAFQIGSEVSYNEISQFVGVDKNTVSSYIRLLELAYIVYPLNSFSRNLRNEIKTNKKIYFYDNGVRNSIIQNFNPLELRNDIGALWENFLMSERLKHLEYSRNAANRYFWRTKQQQEIDYVEETDGIIKGYEFEWNPKAKTKIPRVFSSTYNAKVEVISKQNFRSFVG